MSIDDELAVLPQLDSIPATVDQIMPIRLKYLNKRVSSFCASKRAILFRVARLSAINNAPTGTCICKS